ncbi:MAG: hypothetical protein GEV00_04580 [Actinophytocola sp.]|nr:hypothetical protein [Actinophytocola sp.]
MKFARITHPQASAVLAELGDDLVSAEREEELMAAEVAEIDRLIDEVDRELAAQERIEAVRVSRAFTDARRQRRVRRRADRELLRALPERLDVPAADAVGSEAA